MFSAAKFFVFRVFCLYVMYSSPCSPQRARLQGPQMTPLFVLVYCSNFCMHYVELFRIEFAIIHFYCAFTVFILDIFGIVRRRRPYFVRGTVQILTID